MRTDLAALRRSHLLFQLLLFGLAVLSVLALLRIGDRISGRQGGIDFHPYWYRGHALRQGDNPYDPAFVDPDLKLPIHYLDGKVTSELPVAQPGLVNLPPNTAPLALILFQFSRVSWPTAKWLWTLVNLALVLLLPGWVMRTFPERRSLTPADRWLIHLAFYAFVSTRVAVWVGQTTLVVFALMLAAIWLRPRSWPLAGLCLGLALSKYSLALPLFLWLVLQLRRREWLIAGTGLLVQAAGLVAIALLSGVTPLRVAQDYVFIFRWIVGSTEGEGAQLASLAPHQTLWIVAVALSCLAGFTAWAAYLRRHQTQHSLGNKGAAAGYLARSGPLADYHLWVILVLWTLLAAYHGVYDSLVAVVLLPLGLYAIRNPQLWRLALWQQRLTGLVVAGFVAVLVMPGSIVYDYLPRGLAAVWMQVESLGVTVALMAGSLWVLWLWLRLVRGFPEHKQGRQL